MGLAPWTLRSGALALGAIVGAACAAEGPAGSATCADADSARHGCLRAAGVDEDAAPIYCPARRMERGAPGFMGRGTDWDCLAAAWDSGPCEDGDVSRAESEAARCAVDDGVEDAAADARAASGAGSLALASPARRPASRRSAPPFRSASEPR